MPADMVPYWDFDLTDTAQAPRDASAAAIMASALIELSNFVNFNLREKYLSAASKALASLSSARYLAAEGENGNFILKHSVGAYPKNSEVDVPLTYADYYYVEALIRYLKITGS
ncbi:MAG: hypothetical protein HC896_15910 [Bacteroidales bacterium]|nr:hypothetical protein [Bacteroidales bacterium]